MDNKQLEEAFLKFRDRLERLAAQTLNPVLSGRVSPEDVVQETMVAVSRDKSPFMSNPELPLYFKLRTALLQTIMKSERCNLAPEKRDAYAAEVRAEYAKISDAPLRAQAAKKRLPLADARASL